MEMCSYDGHVIDVLAHDGKEHPLDMFLQHLSRNYGLMVDIHNIFGHLESSPVPKNWHNVHERICNLPIHMLEEMFVENSFNKQYPLF